MLGFCTIKKKKLPGFLNSVFGVFVTQLCTPSCVCVVREHVCMYKAHFPSSPRLFCLHCTLMWWFYIYYVYVDWKRLWILLKWLKRSSLCPVVLANLGNQTVLWLGMQTYRSSPQNGRSKSQFRNFKVVLNCTLTTDFLLIWCTQCVCLSTSIKGTAFHYSYFCYLDYPAPSLPVQKTDSALFEWHSCYWPHSYTVLLLQNLQLYNTDCSVTAITWHKVYPTNDNDHCGSEIGGLLCILWHFLSTYT